MTSQLQHILDLVRQSEQLSTADKATLEKAVKEADKAFEITNFKLDRTEKVKRTTAILLEETIAELEQKRKAVETQKRELEIESALEKVRSRSLSMHKSEELKEVVTVLFQKLQELEFGIDKGAALVMTYSPESKDHTQWITDATQTYAVPFLIPFTEHSIALDQIHAREKQLEFYSKVYDQHEKNEYFRYLFQHTEYKHVPNDVQELILNSKDFGISIAFEKHSAIAIPSTVGKLVSGDEIIILKRFARVFEQSYTRFLDLQKAEAQAREAQIQLALERVRARTMAMQSSEELAEVSYLLNKQVVELGIAYRGCAFNIYNEHDSTEWFSNLEGTLPAYKTPRENIFLKYYEAGQRGETLWTEEFGGDKIKEHYKYLATLSVAGKEEDTIHEGVQAIPEYQIDHVAYFKYGYLLFITLVPAPEAHEVFKRFAKEFEQTYTRFLDLQKAEAQVREAQIEAGLEKVRSKSLAMHRSDELEQVAACLFDVVVGLGIALDGALLFVFNRENRNISLWVATVQLPKPVFIDLPFEEGMQDNEIIREFWKATDHGLALRRVYSGVAKDDYFRYVQRHNGSNIPDAIKQLQLDLPAWHFSFVGEKNTMLGLDSWTGHMFTESDLNTLRRFVRVFEQAYVRFLDLQKAEAQAREAQIQLALERVRARTMAMQRSDELAEAAQLLYQQFHSLGIKTYTCAYMFIEEAQNLQRGWTVSSDGTLLPNFFDFPLTGDPILDQRFQSWKNKQPIHEAELKGEANKKHHTFLVSLQPPEFAQHIVAQLPDRVFFYNANFRYGYLFIVNTEPLTAEEKEIAIRFANVFEQTYTRFLDLQKAEAQARESQIQLALERVRAKTMAMQSSDDLLGVANVLREQMGNLGQPELESSIVHLYHDNSPLLEAWYAFRPPNLSSGEIITGVGIVPKECSAWSREVIAKYNSPETEYTIVASGEKLIEWYKVLEQYAKATVDYDENGQLVVPEVLHYHFSKFSGGALLMISNQEPSAEARELQRRAAVVFDLAYTRFLDLKKAEAQAREAQIEGALEKVRSRSLAMHKSDELQEVVNTVFDRLKDLNMEMDSANIAIFKQGARDFDYWIASPVQNRPAVFHMPYIDWGITKDLMDAKESGADFFEKTYARDEKDTWFKDGFEKTDFKFIDESRKRYILDAPGLTVALGLCRNTGVQINRYSTTPLVEADIAILKRFSKIFEQAYTRFLDLQKAEAQAKEAQIEAALERVRSRTMGMQKSEDLREVVHVLYTQLKELGFQHGIAGIIIMDSDTGDMDTWGEGFEDGYDLPEKYHLPYFEHKKHLEIINHWRSGTPYAVIEIAGEDKKSYDNYYFFQTDFVRVPETTKQFMMQQQAILFSMAYMQYGAINWTPSRISDEQSKILQRFAKVFEQTYTRFLDLQRAEAQTREAQIEASLERVRSRAMAMHSSEDLTATISAFYHELELFSITPRRCGVGLLDKETHMAELSTMNTTEQGKSIEIIGRLKLVGHPVLEGIFDNWLLQKEYHPILRGNEIKEYYQLIRQNVAFPEYPNDAIQYGYFFFFVEGGVYAWTEKPLSGDELKIYRRFTTVLSLTYKRYKDLKDAEVREQEAIKQAALDRVRADIASMRNTADLDRITPLIWKELTTLGIPFIRCGVFIMDDKENKVHTYLSTPEGQAIAAYHIPMNDSGSLAGAIDHWREQKVFVTHWVESDFITQAEVLLKQGSITAREQYLNTLPKGGFYLHFLPFSQGMLYVGSHESLPSEVLQLVQSLADAFSVAYARYEDFTKLESAKAQIEKTLTDLKQTQTQLIQSEKMASLGELTAGIAHEIQNPLNFVNNFSEVSTELIDEMKEELAVGNQQLAIEIANDLKQNLEKINHHGKRADGIVKSMLQHSRAGSGKKELTDINALCDEYLRLSYHGLRAKDKSFNAKFEIQCDPELPKLNVLPQDVGRVVLNLINNAFYAVSERQKVESETLTESGKSKAESLKSSVDKYEPAVTVTTKYLGDKVEIRVKDNGTGIPAKVKEKIFQPFFTTKPTGQGTGLGLSLSYDIITKGHGGEIKMETEEGKGTEFIIQLPIV